MCLSEYFLLFLQKNGARRHTHNRERKEQKSGTSGLGSHTVELLQVTQAATEQKTNL